MRCVLFILHVLHANILLLMMVLDDQAIVVRGIWLDVVGKYDDFVLITKKRCNLLKRQAFRFWQVNTYQNQAGSANTNEDLGKPTVSTDHYRCTGMSKDLPENISIRPLQLQLGQPQHR